MYFWRHKKTGVVHRFLASAVNQSFSFEGQLMIVYCPHDHENTIYVRKQSEFEEAFEPLDDNPCL